MNKGLIIAWLGCLVLAGPLAAQSGGEIYKVVDEHGNVTYTDQRPSEGAVPMDLPPLSVVETDFERQSAGFDLLGELELEVSVAALLDSSIVRLAEPPLIDHDRRRSRVEFG